MPPVLIVHGGCGDMPVEGPHSRQQACERAADIGWRVLDTGGNALDAVEMAIRALEDEPALNAGTGSYLQADGVARMDASIMTGDGRAGAVAQVPGLRNPIRLARYILEQGAHVMLAGPEGLHLAQRLGLETGVPATPERMQYWQRHLSGPSLALDYEGMAREWRKRERLGTVGCVALDREGNLAAATSTGGTPHCYPGRVGDSPIIGAGTYCTRFAGVSMTGLGEAIMTKLSAKRFCDLAGEGRVPIDRAARRVLEEVAEIAPSSAALVALDINGGTVALHDTEFMVTAERR